LLAPAAAWAAHTSPDWSKREAEIKALAGNVFGSIPETVHDEQQAKVTPAAGSPSAWTMIIAGKDPDIRHYTRDPDGLVHRTADQWSRLLEYTTYDASGLIEILSRQYGGPTLVTRLSISAPFIVGTSFSGVSATSHALYSYLPNGDGSYQVFFYDNVCQLAGTAISATGSCTNTKQTVWYNTDLRFLDVNDEKPRTGPPYAQNYTYLPQFAIYCQTDSIADLVDWKIAAGPWHSQTISAALTSSQKEQSRALFVRGFDLYKNGDFTGARALIETGLKTDPGNYLGWFTLAEIGRSTMARDSDDNWAKPAQATYYQHTIDLAPDSPEASLAKGYLAALK